MVRRSMMIGALLAWLFMGAGNADKAALPVSAKDEFWKADAIFVGKIIKFGPVALQGDGHDAVCGVKVNVSKVLHGTVGSQTSLTIDIDGPSSSPAVKPGDSSIFITRKIAAPDPDPYVAFQMLPATDANIALIKQQVSKLPPE